MSILGGIAKDAGVSAVKEAHEAIDGALATVDRETIPAAQAAAAAIVDRASVAFVACAADLANRLNGAEVPIDITATVTLKISGKIGAVKLSAQEYDATVQSSVEVKG